MCVWLCMWMRATLCDWACAACLTPLVPGHHPSRTQVALPCVQSHLSQVKETLGVRSVTYISLNKESHVLEVPDSIKVCDP